MSKQASNEVNIYDFDHTIYKGDCSLGFYFFCVRRNPLLLRYLPFQVLHAALFICKLESRTAFKSHFFVFLRSINTTKAVERFWETHYHKMKAWYKTTDYEQGVIISASPDFLIRPILKKTGMKALIATDMDPATGVINGLNCHDTEKVIRFQKLYPNAVVSEVYSDSLADRPIFGLAKQAFIVRGEKLVPFQE